MVTSETHRNASYAAEDTVADENLKEWIGRGWTLQTSSPCRRCGNTQLYSCVETRQQQKGYNAGTTLTCNPLLFVVFLIFDGIIKLCYPPRIVTTNVDRTICPLCKDEQYKNSRVVSEHPVEVQEQRTKPLHSSPSEDSSVNVHSKQGHKSFSLSNALLMLFIVFLLGYVWWYSFGGPANPPASPNQTQSSSDSQSSGTSNNQEAGKINATVTNEGTGDDYLCKITNNDNFAWSNVSFDFNEILETGRSETTHAESIAPGETVTVKASQFSSDRPLPFAEVRIGCDTPQGRATWDGNLTPDDLRH